MAADADGNTSPPQQGPGSLVGYALAVLKTSSHVEKAWLTREALTRWRTGELPEFLSTDDAVPPERPARDPSIQICEPGLAPKRGKGGSLASRVALLHSLAHIESWAVDLSWDIIARFARSERMPREFYDDWAVVAEDEARHFEALAARLEEVGSRYGALPAHDGLWESAMTTAGSLAARLAVEHCTHEARGLDVLPQTIGRFRAGGDEPSASLMEDVIYPEEVTHCGKGVRWFRYLHRRALAEAAAGGPGGGAADAELAARLLRGLEITTGGAAAGGGGDGAADDDADVAAAFHDVVRRHFHGVLKPPFNDEARARAGFRPSWYLPLVTHGDGSTGAPGGKKKGAPEKGAAQKQQQEQHSAGSKQEAAAPAPGAGAAA